MTQPPHARPATSRSAGPEPLRVALVALVATAVGVAAVEVSLTLAPGIPYPWVFAAYPATGVLCVAVGAWLWDRRPSNRVGRLLVVQGLLVLGAAAGNIDDPQTILLGTVLGEAPIAAMFALVLAFPGGDARPPGYRALVGTGYLVTVGLQVPQSLTGILGPDAWLAVEGHEDLGRLADRVQTWAGAAVLVVGALVAVRTARRMRTAGQRRTLLAVTGYGVVAILLLPLSANVLAPTLGWDVFQRFAFQQALLAGVPLVFATAVVTGAFARTVEVGELRRSLARADASTTPRDALARALGDPDVQVLYRLPDSGHHVDGSGRPRALPDPGSPLRVHRLATGEGGDGGGAAIVYDARIVDRGLVEEAGRVLALAIERDRLTAELAASRDRLQRASRQISRSADETRRRIARDLHDSVQNRLVLAAMEVGVASATLGPGVAEGLETLRAHLDAAMTELRHVVDGVMPPILVEQGIGAAVADLVDRMPLTASFDLDGTEDAVPDVVATITYFVAAEALTNVLKHAGASRVEVRLAVSDAEVRLVVRDDGRGFERAHGTGIDGLTDRVSAVGGRLRVRTADGGGTEVLMELPCAS